MTLVRMTRDERTPIISGEEKCPLHVVVKQRSDDGFFGGRVGGNEDGKERGREREEMRGGEALMR